MKVEVHLVSLPWAMVFQPSVAIGCLKAYVDRYFNGKIKCYSYSAFVEVLIDALGDNFIKFTDPLSAWISDETLFQVAYFEEFKKNDLNKSHRMDFIRQIKVEQKYFSLAVANKLRNSLKKYIENRIVPNLRKESVNIIGMTISMQQSYSAAFVGRYLKEYHPEFNFVFLYGGTSADSVNVANVFADEEIPGFFVIGEGESKLVSIIETIQKIDSWSGEAEEHIAQDTVGVLPVSKRILQYERNKDFYKTQLDMDSLPEPDYREYFETLKRFCEDSGTYDEFMKMVMIPIEGTRGCFGSCDFCGLNRVWRGFRQHSPGQITGMALSNTSKYNCNKVMFVDSSSDEWAEEYADALIARKRSILSSMELRAGHSERFWIKMALSGLRSVQIGVDALSSSLLKAIGKTTTVAQNILAQKYLSELGIKSLSNIMAYHPKSTLDDIKNTKHVFEHVPHFQQYRLSYFALMQGSPFYSQLSEAERRKLKIDYRTPGRGKYKDLYISEFLSYPKNWLSAPLKNAWAALDYWQERRMRRFAAEPERLDVVECSDERLWIRRLSGGKQRDFRYDGKYAAVYELCHRGLSLDAVCDRLQFAESEVIAMLSELSAEKLMIDIEGVFISLALRSRDVLIKDFYKLN